MTERPDNQNTQERHQSLWLLTIGPAVWAVHFLTSYITAAIYCAKFAGPDDSLWVVRVAIGVYTAVALAGIGVSGWIGFRRHTYGRATTPHDFDTPEDRHRFLGFSTLLLSTLSAVATVFVALAAVFMRTCH
ncbi:MAG: hypothetical protein KY476_15615 [Planctomycetes bacterium]|nr:hypothetical protein [Planctomycetota bacterium]